MKKRIQKYVGECAIFACQILLFYLLPLFAGPTDAMGMVFLMLAGTLALSILMGLLPCRTIKYIYPLITAAIFVPSVFLYYNESALVHALWYLIVSLVGVGIGALARKLAAKR